MGHALFFFPPFIIIIIIIPILWCGQSLDPPLENLT
jgi:hypothetical protein